MDDFFYLNVTDHGWQELIATYGEQVTKLVLQDCDLDDKQLDIIIRGFTRLVYLDISGNHIINSEPLKHICKTIEVIKIGPRLISDNNSNELPLNSLLSGNGRKVKELYIQGFLSQQISCVSRFYQLNRLVIKFIKPLFDEQDMDVFSSISGIKTLESLEIYQVLEKIHSSYRFRKLIAIINFYINCFNSIKIVIIYSVVYILKSYLIFDICL